MPTVAQVGRHDLADEVESLRLARRHDVSIRPRINLDNLIPVLSGLAIGEGTRREFTRLHFGAGCSVPQRPAIERWRLSLGDRLGDEGRQRGTSLYRACGRGTQIALPAGKGSVRRPARLKRGGEM